MTGKRSVFADGTVLDTADGASFRAFRRTHGKLLEGLVHSICSEFV
jgi:hypothetical protein